MIDLAIVVEGQTEELFVQRLLQPAMVVHGISVWPALHSKSKSWESVRRDVERLLKQRADRYCSVLFDYYGLRGDWPGRSAAPNCSMSERGRVVEEAITTEIATRMGAAFRTERFIPHIQLHEFEARLFSDCAALASVLGVAPAALEAIVEECGSPEAINDSPHSAPSKRLDEVCRSEASRGYRKTTDGVVGSERVTLAAMRSSCPHFAAWLARIEAIIPPG